MDECLIAPELEPEPMLFCSGSPALVKIWSLKLGSQDVRQTQSWVALKSLGIAVLDGI